MGKNEKVFVKLEPLFTLMQHLKEEIRHYTEDMKKREYWQDVIKSLRDIEQDVFIWFPHWKKLYDQQNKLYDQKGEEEK